MQTPIVGAVAGSIYMRSHAHFKAEYNADQGGTEPSTTASSDRKQRSVCNRAQACGRKRSCAVVYGARTSMVTDINMNVVVQ